MSRRSGRALRQRRYPAYSAAMPLDTDTAGLYARVIKRLGRNAREGASGMLDSADARAIWAALLEQELTRPQEAALLMGLRIHGESPAMLEAFSDVTRLHTATVARPTGGAATVVMYTTGTARRQPILAPLLALHLAQRGTSVLLVTHDAGRGANTTAVLAALGEQPCLDRSLAAQQLASRRFSWMPVEALVPKLARVLARRAELGFRNTGHALLKLLDPIEGGSVLVVNYTHPPYRASLGASVERLRRTALLLRGTEGDPVAWEADAHPLQAWVRGTPVPMDELDLQTSAFGRDHTGSAPHDDLAALPDSADVAGTARLCRAALDGFVALPAALARQAAVLERLARYQINERAQVLAHEERGAGASGQVRVRPGAESTKSAIAAVAAPAEAIAAAPAAAIALRPDLPRRPGAGANLAEPAWREEFFARMALEIGAANPFAKRILELGAGSGLLARWLLQSFPHIRYVLLDPSATALQAACDRLAALAGRARYIEADLRNQGWSEGLPQFDAVVTMTPVHRPGSQHNATLLHAEVRQLLVPGGLYLVCDQVPPAAAPERGAVLLDRYPGADARAQALALRAAGFPSVTRLMQRDGMVLHRAV